MIDAPSGGAPKKAPRWDLTGTEGCGGGTRFLAPYLVVWGYVGIYRKKSVGGASRGPREGRARPGGGRAPYLVASSMIPWLALQVPGIGSVQKITFPKVSFRLDSV